MKRLKLFESFLGEAKLEKESYPKETLIGWDKDEAEYNKVEKELEEASDKATEQNLVGFIWEMPMGDGRAQYRVTKDNGGDNITLQHINLGDAWEAYGAVLKSLKRQDFIQQMKFNNHFKNQRK